MSFGVEGTRFGWGGRFIDQVLRSDENINASFAAISTGSNDVFLSGEQSRPIRVSARGAAMPSLITSPSLIGRSSGDDAARAGESLFRAIRSWRPKRFCERPFEGSIARLGKL